MDGDDSLIVKGYDFINKFFLTVTELLFEAVNKITCSSECFGLDWSNDSITEMRFLRILLGQKGVTNRETG